MAGVSSVFPLSETTSSKLSWSWDNAEWMRSRYGVLKGMVPRWLNEKDFTALVSGSGPAHRRHGGEGALYVYLRKRA